MDSDIIEYTREILSDPRFDDKEFFHNWLVFNISPYIEYAHFS